MSTSLQIRLLASTALMVTASWHAHAQTAPAASGTTVLSPIVVQTPSEPAPRSAPARPAPEPSQGSSAPAATAPSEPAVAPSALDALTTSGEKQAARVYDAPGTVTVKSTAEMERQNVNNIRDLVRDEPGISVSNSPTRAGVGNFVIRGIGENRVRVEVDGIKVQDFPAPNAFSPGGYNRDFVDLDAMKRVEIIRGPASALYGSDALGGVVAYVTKDPADYLALVKKDWYASLKVGFDSVDRSFYTTLTGANRIGAFDSMLLVTRRWGHEVEPNGSMRANPQFYELTNVLGKIIYNCPGCGQIGVTGEYSKRGTDTNVKTDLTSTVLSSIGDDTNVRQRVSLDWSSPVHWWLADSVKAKVYASSGEREEVTDQIRNSGARLRHSYADFDQTIMGGDMQATVKRFAFGGEHLITYGLSFDRTETIRPRDRYELTFATNTINRDFTASGAGLYPNKLFPDTTTTQAAAFIQDVAKWGPLTVTPAVRVDYYNLKSSPDQLFANSNPGGSNVANLETVAVSPKLGATYDLTQQLRLFGQYAHGFRAPPYDNINYGFKNPAFGYELIPNANLVPETVNGFEAGIRGRSPAGSSFQITSFYNMYKDFLDIVCVSACAGPVQQYSYMNLSNVTIYGWEAKGEYRMLPEWALFGSLAYAHGSNTDTGAAIDSVDPFRAVGGVRYKSLSTGWGGEVRANWVAEKDRTSLPTYFHSPSYTTVDMLASYEVAPTFTLNAGVFNIFDKSYFNPTDINGIAASSPTLELLRAPGRSVSANMTVRW